MSQDSLEKLLDSKVVIHPNIARLYQETPLRFLGLCDDHRLQVLDDEYRQFCEGVEIATIGYRSIVKVEAPCCNIEQLLGTRDQAEADLHNTLRKKIKECMSGEDSEVLAAFAPTVELRLERLDWLIDCELRMKLVVFWFNTEELPDFVPVEKPTSSEVYELSSPEFTAEQFTRFDLKSRLLPVEIAQPSLH